MKPRFTRRGISFSIHHPHLAFLLLSGRLNYEELLQALASKDIDYLRNKFGPARLREKLPQSSQESIEETLRLSIATRESSWGRLNQWHGFLYAMTRSVLPQIVVETGVLYGHSSAAILAGLEDNGSGKLISIDLPPDQHRSVIVEGQYLQVGLSSNELSVGCAVPPKIRSRWTLQLGNSLELLPKILKQFAPISMFVHDSLHTYDHMIAEFRLGYDMLEPGGLLISDDIGYNLAWHDFCRSRKEEWKEFSKGSDKNDRFGFLIKSSS